MHILWSGDHERIYRLKLLQIGVIMPLDHIVTSYHVISLFFSPYTYL